MAIVTEKTTFTLDTQGRFLCNTLDEALHSTGVNVGLGSPAADAREFDTVIVGGGSFGAIFAQHLLAMDDTRSRRVLILERGPYIIPEHEQNLPYIGGVTPAMEKPWVSDVQNSNNNIRDGFAGLQVAVGGRSLKWGGWSPELLDDEMRTWPPIVVSDLKNAYFPQAADQLGTNDTNDFLYGPLHAALRSAFHARTTGLVNTLPFAEWPDHALVRYKESTASDARLRELLGFGSGDPVLPRAKMLDFLKLEAPLAVQSKAEPGEFPTNKFSSVPLLIRAIRQDIQDSNGRDEHRRVMIVPNAQVLELVTTTTGSEVAVTGVRVNSNLNNGQINLAPGGIVAIASGTVESTRLAKSTFKDSLATGVGPKIGKNLMAHLRSNLNLRLPLASLGLTAADLANKPLPVSALFLKGRAIINGQNRYFHLQITASAGGANLGNSEALLFQKVPDLDSINALQQATPTHVVVTLRGIGEMAPDNASSQVSISTGDFDAGKPAAWVTLGNAREYAKNPSAVGSSPAYQKTTITQATIDDATAWTAMDDWTDAVAAALANGQPFDVLIGGSVKPFVAGTTAAQLKAQIPHDMRRDDLGTTHHEAGTMRSGDVTDDLGRLEGTPNCYFLGPCLFPTIGSPNPMLTGTALSRRTADYLNGRLGAARPKAPPLPRTGGKPQETPADAAGWQVLFDGTQTTYRKWQAAKSGNDCEMQFRNGHLFSTGSGDHALLYYAAAAFSNFVLRVQFQVLANKPHNGGIFVRIRRPDLDLPAGLAALADANQFGKQWRSNRAWTGVYSGFEVQIDDDGLPNGSMKNRTGAIYDIPAGDPGEPTTQTYAAGPSIKGGEWFEMEVTVQGDTYTVKLGLADGSPKSTVTTFVNTDATRGIAKSADANSGLIALQAHNGGRVLYRHVRILEL